MPRLPSGTVTFLFTDIEGSTRLLKQLGDRYGDLLGEHQRLLRAVFTETGGHEIKTQGDSFFVAFQRARDALDASVRAQRSFARQEWPDGVDVRVRMGIHTGEPRFGGDDYVGMGVHRAARISSAAHAGQILLSSATRELVEDDLPSGLALRDLGEHRLKDVDRPERIFQVVADDLPAEFPALEAEIPVREAEAIESEEWSESRMGGFVGREEDLRQMLDALAEADKGRGRLVLIGGEPGIGKSRLVEEFARHATERRARVLWGRCWEAGGAPAYWPWVQAIRSYIRDAEPGALTAQLGRGAPDVAKFLPELHEIYPDLRAVPSDDSEGARFRLFDSTSLFLREAAKERPLVLIFEDLHAADAPSVLLLQFLARALSESRVLAVGTYRDLELMPASALASALADLGRERATRRIQLQGLDQADIGRIIEGIAEQTPPEGAIARLHEDTEGNPLFVGEVVRLLAAERRFGQSGDTEWTIPLPQSVREVIGRRLHHLSDACKRALAVASVLGRDFRLDVLERVSEMSADELFEVLDEALAARVLAEIPGAPGRFRFSHALIRDTLYEEQAVMRRLRVHWKTGEVLEAVHVHDVEPHLSELAHHFLQAAPVGDVGKAVEYARRAGALAITLLAFEEAVRLYRGALRALEARQPVDEQARAELLTAMGDAQARAGDTPAAKRTFLDAADVARRLGDGELLARAALGYGGRFVWEAGRDDPQLRTLLEEAVQSLGDAETPIRARVLARLAGGPLREERDRAVRDDVSAQAVEIARRTGDAATVAYALDGRYAAVWWADNLDERLEIAADLVCVAQEVGDKERELQGRHYRILALLERGDMPAVYRELQEKARLASELRQPAHGGTFRPSGPRWRRSRGASTKPSSSSPRSTHSASVPSARCRSSTARFSCTCCADSREGFPRSTMCCVMLSTGFPRTGCSAACEPSCSPSSAARLRRATSSSPLP